MAIKFLSKVLFFLPSLPAFYQYQEVLNLLVYFEVNPQSKFWNLYLFLFISYLEKQGNLRGGHLERRAFGEAGVLERQIRIRKEKSVTKVPVPGFFGDQGTCSRVFRWPRYRLPSFSESGNQIRIRKEMARTPQLRRLGKCLRAHTRQDCSEHH